MKKGVLIVIVFTVAIGLFFFSGVNNKNSQQTEPESLLKKSSSSSTAVNASSVIPLTEMDTIRIFFSLIEGKKISDAVGMMSDSITKDDSQKQAWGVQFNAIKSIKILNTEPSMQEEWTATRHTYKITMDIVMDPSSASAPIPYYGYENGQNIRWITLEKLDNVWKIIGIATGP